MELLLSVAESAHRLGIGKTCTAGTACCVGSIPAKLAITNSSSLGLNHITASLARIFSNLLPDR